MKELTQACPLTVRLPVKANRTADWQPNYAGTIQIEGKPVSIQVWLNSEQPGAPLTLRLSQSTHRSKSIAAS